MRCWPLNHYSCQDTKKQIQRILSKTEDALGPNRTAYTLAIDIIYHVCHHEQWAQ